MGKPLAVEIKSDDYTTTLQGVEYHPHEGESVWMFRGQTVGEVAAMNHFNQMQVQVDAAKGEPDELARVTALFDDALQHMCTLLADRIDRWTWTDKRGRPLAQPADDPLVLHRLETDELAYLLGAAKGETAQEKKDATKPSPITSSDTAPVTSLRSSSTDRSRRRAS